MYGGQTKDFLSYSCLFATFCPIKASVLWYALLLLLDVSLGSNAFRFVDAHRGGEDLPRDPLLFLPGLFGSIIDARRGDGIFPPECAHRLQTEYSQLWLRLTDAFNLSCFKKMMVLDINENATSKNPSFIQTQIPSDGIYATSYLDPKSRISRYVTQYYANMYSFLTSQGYELYKNLDAIAYDWRQSPYNFFQPGDYFDRLKSRIELMFNQNQGKKITLVGHSMGGATTALFLSSFVDSEWKEKYVKQFISIAGVYGGSVDALAAIITGNSSILSSYLKEVTQNIPGIHSLIPISNALSPIWGTHPIFRIGDRTYTTDDVPRLYADLNLKEFASTIQKLRSVGYHLPPGVSVHCIFNDAVPTISSIEVKSTAQGDLRHPKFTKSGGDGTVPDRSLYVCSGWYKEQEQPVVTKIVKSSHTAVITSDRNVWEYVLQVTNKKEDSDKLLTGSVSMLYSPYPIEEIDPETFFMKSSAVFTRKENLYRDLIEKKRKKKSNRARK